MESANKTHRQLVAQFMANLSAEDRRRFGHYLNPTGSTPFISDQGYKGAGESVEEYLKAHSTKAVKLA